VVHEKVELAGLELEEELGEELGEELKERR